MIKNIIVTDIFGKTPSLLALGEVINADLIVDPYDGRYMSFENEAQAYDYFIKNVGLDTYFAKLSSVLLSNPNECILIGFSVGASVIWKLSELASPHIIKQVKKAICYYGSQIRHLTELSPVFNVELVFPRAEVHFDVSALHRVLSHKENVSTMQVEYLHGFMNTHSHNFDREGYNKHLALLSREL